MEIKYRCIRLMFLMAVALTSQSCNSKKTIPEDEVFTNHNEPKTIAVSLDEGYVQNQLTGDTIVPLVNSYGDTVNSGTHLKIVSETPRLISLPNSTQLKKPNVVASTKYVHQVPDNLVTGIIDKEVATSRVNKEDLISYQLINSTGDTLPTNIPHSVSGRVIKFPLLHFVQALIPRMKDNAMHDIQYLDVEQGLGASNVNSILIDRNENLWIGSDGGGLNRYDGTILTNYKFAGGEYVRFIYEDKSGLLWYGGPDGLTKYDGSNFTYYGEKEGMPINWVTSILQDKNGTYWIGTFGGGIVKYSVIDSIEYFTYLTIKEGLPSNYINTLMEDSAGNLWIGTRNAGACSLNLSTYHTNGVIEFFYLDQRTGLSHNNIWSIVEDDHNRIWFGSLKGLNIYEPQKNQRPAQIRHISQNEGLPGDFVYSVFLDEDKKIWVGTNNGIARIELNEPDSFHGLTIIVYNEDSGITNNVVFDFANDKSGGLWLATYGGGINRLNEASFSYITKKEGLPDNTITAIMESSDGSFWVGTFGGLVHFNSEKNILGDIHQYTLEHGLPNPIIRCIIEDNRQNIWLGTNSGVVLIESPIVPDALRFKSFTQEQGIDPSVIRTLFEDRDGNIWAGSNGGGIYRIQNKAGSKNEFVISHFSEKEGIPGGYIKTIHQDKLGNFWFGTNLGLVNYHPETDTSGSIIIYTEKEGLPNNIVNSIVEDLNGNLWLATDKGIACFENFQSSEGRFTYYSEREGLLDDWSWNILSENKGNQLNDLLVPSWTGLNVIREINNSKQIFGLTQPDGLKGIYTQIWDKAALLDSKKRLWLGRAKGLEVLDLNKFDLSSSIPQPVLRRLEVNGENLDFHKLKDSINSGIDFSSTASFENYPLDLTLTYRKNHLTFHFSAIDWAAPHKIRYSYFLEGLDDKWSNPGTDSKAEYRNLPSGTHTFKVRAIGESQKWSEPVEYTFTIRPPWWYSWWAFAMYGFFGGFILYRSHRFQVNRKLEIAEKKRLVELDQVRNRLYTNITHEFRTPLTLIHGPVSQALSKNATLDQKDIQSIHRQSERLQELINQMLELQKLEAGMLKPHYTYGEIIQSLRNLFGSFETWAEEKKISMLFSSSLQQVHMDFDKEKLTQIISNLVSNAIKHTPRNGKVGMVVGTSSSGEFLLINITDTGIGISEEDLPFVFDRFYQTKKAASGGSGIGLALVKNLAELLGGQITVESKVDIGSTFKLMLPITKQAPVLIEPAAGIEILFDDVEDEDLHDKKTPGKPIALIVEDHPDVLKYLVSCFSPDYTTVTAVNGNEGLQLAYDHTPDLIVSDVMMPGIDGFELCTILKTDIKTSHIPIILLTGKGDHEAMMSGIEHGADAYVLKPFDPAELSLRARKLLELRNTLRHYYRQNASASKLLDETVSSSKENEFLKNVRVFIDEHLNDAQFNMNMLCNHMAMSHPQLHRKITALTGESAGKFVRSIRLAKAVELLKNSDLTVSEIAYETGFSEPGYFTKVFSKEFNQSPTEFRASQQH